MLLIYVVRMCMKLVALFVKRGAFFVSTNIPFLSTLPLPFRFRFVLGSRRRWDSFLGCAGFLFHLLTDLRNHLTHFIKQLLSYASLRSRITTRIHRFVTRASVCIVNTNTTSSRNPPLFGISLGLSYYSYIDFILR